MKVQNGWYHLLISALADFKRNKIRTFLTSLGIMIGVLSVVMLIALGIGLKNFLTQQFENLGANLIIVLPGQGFQGGPGPGLVGGANFDERDLATVQRIGGLDLVSPGYFKGITLKADGEETSGYIQGINSDGIELLNLNVLEGRLLTDSEMESSSKKGLLGFEAARKLFKEEPRLAVGETVRFENQRYKVLGVLEKIGDNESDNGLFVPYKSTFGNINPDKTFFSLNIGVKSEDDVADAKVRIEEALLKRYDEDDFTVSEQAEILDTINQIFAVVNALLVAIGSISLVVGGIGIMNIMYATVTERTKEVGIRRALGATKNDILMQFLTESVVLSVFGGTLGLILAAILVMIIRIWFPVGMNVLAVVVAFGVSSLIGIFFGVFPARRAANLAPIEAIRYE